MGNDPFVLIVEADGKIALGSIELVGATYRDFVSSVLDALVGWPKELLAVTVAAGMS